MNQAEVEDDTTPLIVQQQQQQESLTINEVSAKREDTSELQVRLPATLYKRLVQTYVLSTSIDLPVEEDGNVTLPFCAVAQYLNGYTFGKYMVALKLLVTEHAAGGDRPPSAKLAYHPARTRCKFVGLQLRAGQKTGITIEPDSFKQLEDGETEAVNRLFARVERYMKILCGAEFLNFEDSENVFEQLGVMKQQPSVEINDHTSVIESVSKSVDLQSFSDHQKVMFKGSPPPKGLIQISSPDKHELNTPAIDQLEQIGSSNAQTPIASSPTKIEEWSQSNQHVSKLVRQKPRQVTEGVDIVTIQTDRPLGQTQNSLEFLLVTLSRSFELTPRQAAALLTNNNQYLVTACVKGIKGGFFHSLISWYREIHANVTILAELLLAELEKFNDQQSIQKVLATLASGLYSTNTEVVEMTFQLLIQLLALFEEDPSLPEVALKWFFTNEEGGLRRAVHALKHSNSALNFVQLTNQVCKVPQQLELMYRHEVFNHCRSTGEYIVLILEIIDQLALTRQMDVEQSGLIDYWLDLTAREAENNGMHSVEERSQATALMVEIWVNFSDYIGEQENRANTIVYMLKRACREHSRLVKAHTAALMFRLLDIFSVSRNPAAPYIYKTLVFNVVEAPQDLTLRELYFQNFRELFMTQPKIPIALLVEPLLKQVQQQMGITYHLKTVDIDFFSFLADHPKLHVELSIQLMDLLQKLCFHDTVHFASVAPIFFRLIQTNIDDERMLEAVRGFVDNALVLLYEIELQSQAQAHASQPSVKGRAPSRYSQQQQSKAPLAKNQSSESLAIKDTLLHYKKQAVFLMLQKLHSLSNEQISEDLCEQLKLIQAKMIEQLDPAFRPSAVDQLLELFGVSSVLLVPHAGAESFVKSKSSSSQQRRQAQERQQMVPFVAEKSVNQSQASGLSKKKVLMDIERIKKLKQDRDQQKRSEQERQDQLQDRRKASVRRQIERRRIELGVGNGRGDSQPKAILSSAQTESASPYDSVLQQRINRTVVWHDLNDEEDCNSQAVVLFMKKTQKLWRNLFSKYANVGYKIVPLHERGSFEGLNKQQENITLAEITKLYKDHDAYPQVLTKEDLVNLMRLVNTKHNQQSLTQLGYQHFTTFIVQSALNGYSRSLQTLYLAPVDKLKLLFHQFESATRKRGATTLLYDCETELIQSHDAEIIAQLTRKVNENPTYPLPEGLTKAKEKCQVQSYCVSETILPLLSESQQVVLPLLDQLVWELFQIHYLEPYTTFEEQYRIKPQIQKGMPPKPPTLNFPTTSARQSGSSSRPSKLAPIASNKQLAAVEQPSVQMQDAVAATEHTYDDELQYEISRILDQMVNACFAPPDQPQNSNFKNGLARNAKAREFESQQNEALREAKRKARDAQIKTDLERLKVERAEREARQAEQKAEADRLAKLAEQKRQEATRKSINRIIEEARQREPRQNKDASAEPAKPKAASKPPPPPSLTKEQIAKQRQSHIELMQKLSQQNQLLQQKEEEKRQKELSLREATKRKNEKQMAIQRQQRQRDFQFNAQLADLMESNEFVTLTGKYDHMLCHVFKFYCTQAKVDLRVDPNFKQTHMSLAEFTKFGYQSKVVPVLVTADEMMVIFRTVEKSQTASAQALYERKKAAAVEEHGRGVAHHMLGYDSFKQALIRIVAYSYPKLENTQDAASSSTSAREQQRSQSNERVRDFIQKKENDKKAIHAQVIQEMRTEFLEKVSRQQQALGKSPPAAASKKGVAQRSSSQDKLQSFDDADFQKWMKQQESLGNGLQKRIEARQNQSSAAGGKQLKVQKQIELAEKLSKADIRDGRVISKEWDFNNVSIQAFEKLLKFIGIQKGSDLSVSQMNDVINSQRVENQGHHIAQNKLKKLLLPQLNDLLTIQENADGEDLGKTYEKNALPTSVNVEESGDFYGGLASDSELNRGGQLRSSQPSKQTEVKEVPPLRGGGGGVGRYSHSGADKADKVPTTIQTEKMKAQHRIETSDDNQDLPVELIKTEVPELIAEAEQSKEQESSVVAQSRNNEEEDVTVGGVNQDAEVRSEALPVQKQQVNDDDDGGVKEANPEQTE